VLGAFQLVTCTFPLCRVVLRLAWLRSACPAQLRMLGL
jgi:hypothetical protein